MGPHGHVSIDVDPEVTDRRNWLHISAASMDRTRRDLMLSTRRCASENFSLGVIQLQPLDAMQAESSSTQIDTSLQSLAESVGLQNP